MHLVVSSHNNTEIRINLKKDIVLAHFQTISGNIVKAWNNDIDTVNHTWNLKNFLSSSLLPSGVT